MDIYLKDGMAFVDLKAGYLLCIGTREEVEGAPDHKILQMVKEAIAVSQYRSIETSKGQHVN